MCSSGPTVWRRRQNAVDSGIIEIAPRSRWGSGEGRLAEESERLSELSEETAFGLALRGGICQLERWKESGQFRQWACHERGTENVGPKAARAQEPDGGQTFEIPPKPFHSSKNHYPEPHYTESSKVGAAGNREQISLRPKGHPVWQGKKDNKNGPLWSFSYRWKLPDFLVLNLQKRGEG